MMAKNRPRIFSTNKRMEGGVFVYLLSIRGWSLGEAKVNALWELQSGAGEELSALMPSVLDRAFKGEL
jgi:hypothetical protein